jgi:hypothetical protein
MSSVFYHGSGFRGGARRRVDQADGWAGGQAGRQDLAVALCDRSTPWAAKSRVAGPALLERGL